jgi:hypothetical protein
MKKPGSGVEQEAAREAHIQDLKKQARKETNRTGSLFSSEGSFQCFSVDGKRYLVSHAPEAWGEYPPQIETDDHEKVPVTDLAIHKELARMMKEDVDIRKARTDLVKELANGDEDLEHIYLLNIYFNQGELDDPKTESDIGFYQVGRNASHLFFFGARDGKKYMMVESEGMVRKSNYKDGVPSTVVLHGDEIESLPNSSYCDQFPHRVECVWVCRVEEVKEWPKYFGHH